MIPRSGLGLQRNFPQPRPLSTESSISNPGERRQTFFVMRRRNHDRTAGENRQPGCDTGLRPENNSIELNAFNDRIIELETEGHRGHAMEVMQAKAVDLARQIDGASLLIGRTAFQG